MLDKLIFKDELGDHYVKLFLEFFFLSLLVCFVNSLFLGGNFIFLVALLSIVLAYPITKYVRTEDRKVFIGERHFDFLIFDKETIVFLLVFVAALLAMLITFPLLSDVSFHSTFASFTGHITGEGFSLEEILLNNLYVGVVTFIVGLLSTSAIVFILIWNASVLTYVVAQGATFLNNFVSLFGYIGHGLLEIAGYVFFGLAATILSYRLDLVIAQNKSDSLINTRHATAIAFLDAFLLVLIGVLFIIIAALLEIV